MPSESSEIKVHQINRSDLILDRVSSFYKKHADDYAKIWGDSDPNLPQFYEALSKLVPEKGKLLDSGCGPGRDLINLMKAGFDVYGISICQEEIDIASKQSGLNGKVQVMDMRDLRFPSSSYNVIWDNAAFVHIPSESAETVLKGYHRILETNGILFLRVKEGEGETEIDTSEYDDGETRFYKFYKQEELTTLVEKSGFEILDVETLAAIDGRNINWVHVFARKK